VAAAAVAEWREELLELAGAAGSTVRFFKRGPITVVRTGLDVRDALITDTEDKLQVGYEARALRPWEEFDESILRWSLRAVVGPGGAGTFGGVMIAINGSGANFVAADPVPRGSLIVIDEVNNLTANAVQLMIGAASTSLTSAVPADFTDARWGPKTAIPPVRAVSGTPAAITGDEIDAVLNPQRYQKEGFFIGITEQVAEPLGGDQCLTIFSNTANVQFNVRVKGRIVLPR
jgi:hypothetical protein